MHLKLSGSHLNAVVGKVVLLTAIFALVLLSFGPAQALAQGTWGVSSTQPDKAYGEADKITDQEAILRLINKVNYFQMATPQSQSVRNLRALAPYSFSSSYPMFPKSSSPWRVVLEDSLLPAVAPFDVRSDWETFAIDLTYISLISIMELVPLPTGCIIEPFLDSPEGTVFLIEMSPYFISVVGNLKAGDIQGATNALRSALELVLDELPSRLQKVGLSCLGDAVKAWLPGVGQAVAVIMIAVKVTPIIVDWISYPRGVTAVSFTYTAPAPTATGRIAFSSDRDSNFEIYIMNSDGTGQTNLTNNSATDQIPDWSPDGQRIVFLSNRDGNNEIYVMNSDGSNQTRLTNNSATDDNPDWSPDGRRIAFDSNRGLIIEKGVSQYAYYEIYVMNSDGTPQTRLTNNTAFDSSPAWSPDGQRIAFSSDRDSNLEIYVMNSDGTSQTRLTNHPSRDEVPAFSPDGRRIVFLSNRDGNFEIYVMNSDGSAQTNLTNNPGYDRSPVWSPDGQRIAFTSNRDGDWEIYVMNSDGSAQTRLTKNPATGAGTVWSPDGLHIAFVSNRDGNFEIYVMKSDGSARTRLTDNSAWDGNPAWSP